MTQAKAAIIETDLLVFPVKAEEKEFSTIETKTEVVEVKNFTLRIDIDKRFARLRKSMRKRSASIF